MDTFTIRDLRERTSELIKGAEEGELAVVTKHGQPVFLAVPMDETLLREGLGVDLAIKLYEQQVVSLGKAARLADLDIESFIERLTASGVAVADYDADELGAETEVLGR